MACKSLYDCLWAMGNINPKELPIWNNSNVCTYCNRDWFEKGVICVYDLLENGIFMSLEQFRANCLRCNFLEHATLKRKIQQLDIPLDVHLKIGPVLPVMLEAISL